MTTVLSIIICWIVLAAAVVFLLVLATAARYFEPVQVLSGLAAWEAAPAMQRAS